MSEWRKVELGEIFVATADLVSRRFGMLAAVCGLMVAIHLLLEALAGELSFFLSFPVDVMAFLFVTQRLLDNHERTFRRLGSVFAIGILSGLGVILGLVLMIVPGAIFAARWWLAVPLAVAEDKSPTAALSASWRMTAPSQPALIALACMQFGVIVAAAVTIFYVIHLTSWDIDWLPFQFVTEAGISVVQLLSTVSSVAAYRLIQPDGRGLRAIFS